jgi:hypothetical protein
MHTIIDDHIYRRSKLALCLLKGSLDLFRLSNIDLHGDRVGYPLIIHTNFRAR